MWGLSRQEGDSPSPAGEGGPEVVERPGEGPPCLRASLTISGAPHPPSGHLLPREKEVSGQRTADSGRTSAPLLSAGRCPLSDQLTRFSASLTSFCVGR